MAMSFDTHTHIATFNLEPKDNCSARWTRWLTRFNTYLTAMDITDTKRQRALLLLLVGEEVHNLFLTLPDIGGDSDFEKAIKALDDHFLPKSNREYEIFKFRSIVQGSDTIDQFYSKLREAATNCEFANSDSEIKSQVIQKCRSHKLRENALCNPKMTLSDILKQARTLEFADMQSKTMESSIQGASANQQAVQTVSVKKSDVCYHCGGTWPHRGKCPAWGKVCPAWGKVCQNCGQKNHFPLSVSCHAKGKICGKCGKRNHLSEVCRSSGQIKQKSKKYPYRAPKSQKGKNIHNIEDDGTPTECEEYSLDMYHIETSAKSQKFCCELSINGIPVTMEVDSGADITLISEEMFHKVENGNERLYISTENIPTLRTYSGETNSIKPIGIIQNVPVQYSDQFQNLPLIVTPGNGPNLLGKNWMSAFTKIDWNKIFGVNKLHQNKSDLDQLLDKYPEVFDTKLGCLQGTKVTIHVNKDITPKFCKPRTVAFAYKQKVSDELDRLVNEGVLKPVSFSKWATPIVPVLKSNGQIRVCGDYKQTINKVAKTDVYPLPHIDELYTKLAGGESYTKLDLSNAYLQLELDDSSQELTTINTEKGLFSYTRMPFGISAAPAIFQKNIETVLQGIPKTSVYIDDILVTGKNHAEHLKNLESVLSRLRGSGLRLKRNKCSFMKSSVTYLGHVIDSQGVHPSPEKTKAIKDAPVPNNVSELRSYLGLLNYYHKFLPNLSTTLAPLYQLLNNSSPWQWQKAQMDAFNKSKELLQSS